MQQELATQYWVRITDYRSLITDTMGFPEWTLWGMGICALGALLMLGLALLAQSPSTLTRMRLLSARLDLRARAFTGYAFALLLLAFGFFFAGVPIEPGAETAASAGTPLAQTDATLVGSANETGAGFSTPLPTDTPTPRPTLSSAGSGSFGSAPPEVTDTAVPEGNTSEATAAPTATPTATGTPAATSTPTATPTHTPTSTVSPTPTVTPTPIQGETAVITTQGNPISLRRAPGGQQVLTQLQNGTVVVVQNGRANQGTNLWREIRTTDGVLGWVPEEFLTIETP